MNRSFKDRAEAGRMLGARLSRYAGQPAVLVLALPRGGVPVAHEVAHVLRAPMEVLVVRKLGLPGDEELAVGAIGPGGVRVLNHELIDEFGVTTRMVDQLVQRERQELARREGVYRKGRGPLACRGATVIIVDDGAATGATMHAAALVVRAMHPGRIVLAAPVIAREAYFELRGKVDEIAAVQIPKELHSVGEHYVAFPQLTDHQVCELLAEPVA